MLVNLKEILSVAQRHDFTVGAFNITEAMNFRTVFETAEKLKSPAILAVSTQEFDLVYPQFYDYIKPLLMNSRNVYCLHLDHGHNMKNILAAIRSGFTSVMIDGSSLPLEENIQLTKSVCDLCHLIDVSVEGELGMIGVNNYEKGTVDSVSYTDPMQAKQFIEQTNVDALAVAIGTAHGLYPKNYVPHLNFDLLKKLNQISEVPLVLHGGSGNPDAEIRKACELGIRKVNISSEYKVAFADELRKILNETDDFTFSAIMPKALPKAKQVIKNKMYLFDSVDRQDLYYKDRF